MQLLKKDSQLTQLIEGIPMGIEEVFDLSERMVNAYGDLSASLPDSNPWKVQALQNSLRMQHFVISQQAALGTNKFETLVIGLLALTHGLGRLAEASPTYLEKYPNEAKAGHGALAAAVFREIIDTPKRPDPFLEVASYAIAHRPDAEMPRADAFPNELWRPAAHELLGILRDIVMYDGLVPERIRAKLEDSKEKERLKLANWSAARRSQDLQLGCERGHILPPDQLKRFTNREALVRSQYESYETLMLETLSYVFKFTTLAITELTVQAGGPSLVLSYLRRQLVEEDEFQAIKNTLFRWNDRLAVKILAA